MFARYSVSISALICVFGLILALVLFFDPIRASWMGTENSSTATTAKTVTEVGAQPVAGKVDPHLIAYVRYRTGHNGTEEFSYRLRMLEDFKFARENPPSLWLETMRPDWPQHPDVSPIIGNSCLEPHRGEALTTDKDLALAYSNYVVCRVVAEKTDGFDGVYDKDASPKAVIGFLWGKPNHQPVSRSRERCNAEARVWATTIAQPDDRFILCVMVVDAAEGVVESYAYELSPGYVFALPQNGSEMTSRWRRIPTKRRASANLETYIQIQDWIKNDDDRKRALKETGPGILTAISELPPSRDFSFVEATISDEVIKLTIEVQRPNEFKTWTGNSAARKAASWLRKPLCNSDHGGALLAYQQNVTSFRVTFVKPDQSPLRETWLPPMLCI
ncbi:hypothetical protein [Ruegeria sp. R14_0]|uniref:hypothetical protein n=1 Tax=Ruegeria sp. R14_0 TaxID=2821100 RepID=UPI001ADB24C6|nr:hypothetical protein [Ruegeria sp. R14_0]MBO9445784.1 hypothetical protein [Ruegeria sp. R14_0]